MKLQSNIDPHAGKCSLPRILELWEVGNSERYLKQFVKDELPMCFLAQSTGRPEWVEGRRRWKTKRS